MVNILYFKFQISFNPKKKKKLCKVGIANIILTDKAEILELVKNGKKGPSVYCHDSFSILDISSFKILNLVS